MMSRLLVVSLWASLFLIAESHHYPGTCILRVPCIWLRRHPHVSKRITASVYGFSRDVREKLLVHFDRLTIHPQLRACAGITCMILDLYCQWLKVYDPVLYSELCFGPTGK